MRGEAWSLDRAAAAFVPRLVGFVAFVRSRGVPVGVGGELDLARALGHLSVLDREAFLGACRAVLAKSPRDLRLVEEAFDEYWSLLPYLQTAPPSAGGTVPRPPPVSRAPPVDAESTGERAIPGDPTGVVRIGVYSPDAPPVGHPLSPVERRRLAALRSGARRFRQFAASLPGRRFRPHPRGRIDFPATARRSLRHGGEWLDMRRRRQKTARAEFVLLWDVSGSMRDHDTDLFALVYALHRASRRCRVFAFSTHLEEITGFLRARPYHRAMAATSRSLAPAAGGTRIGRCLADFRRRFGTAVHPWTTVVVLSDGWDLGETDLLALELDWVRRRAHLLIWVNPYADLPEFEPATAGMREALPYVDALLGPRGFETGRRFRVVRSLEAS